MDGLSAPAVVAFDQWGIPRIQAETREDAFRVLGYVTARDRLFQMDLLRRSTAGRLAEITGPGLVESDRWHRTLGFSHLAATVYPRLPADQCTVLDAYSGGVNAAMDAFQVLPFEFLVLGYTPEPWRPEDSLLVVLNMAVVMNWNRYTEDMERAATVMKATLPAKIINFLMPRSDHFIDRLLGMESGYLLPLKDLVDTLQRFESPSGQISDPAPPRGSNAWVVGPSKSRTGRAILANDMHLDLSVPNLWYRAQLHYGEAQLYGLFLPGVPALVVGSNGHLAWGLTGTGADVADLILLDIDPEYPDAYRTPDGWRTFATRIETIKVRDQADVDLIVRTTEWGPVLNDTLVGQQVAVQWNALDPGAVVNLKHLEVDRVFSVEEAFPLFNRVGVPTLNVLLADSRGNIGWTLTGRLPRRKAGDGLFACRGEESLCSWDGYLGLEETPRIFNPPSGVLVNANQPMSHADLAMGHNTPSGYRALRIRERLADPVLFDEGDMLALQLDTQAGFYRFYRDLAVETLNDSGVEGDQDREALIRYLQSWDGRAETGSLGLPLVVEFRRRLLNRVLSPLLSSSQQLDPVFEYRWTLVDRSLQQLLESRPVELLPDPDRYPSWHAFLLSMLEESARSVLQDQPNDGIEALTWGCSVGAEQIAHPLSEVLPLAERWLDMPAFMLPGCPHCVRVTGGGGATERLVVSPGEEDRAILHMPGGQSGHPLSPHYRDQHPAWVQGSATPLKVGRTKHRLTLIPAHQRSTDP